MSGLVKVHADPTSLPENVRNLLSDNATAVLGDGRGVKIFVVPQHIGVFARKQAKSGVLGMELH